MWELKKGKQLKFEFVAVCGVMTQMALKINLIFAVTRDLIRLRMVEKFCNRGSAKMYAVLT